MRIERIGIPEAAKHVDATLTKAEVYDYLNRDGNKTISISATEGGFFAIVSFGLPDDRRNAHPLEFSRNSKSCFCDWSAQQPGAWFAATESSHIFLRNDRAHQYASTCGPEPTAEHYCDMMDLARHLVVPNITVVNLVNSGASVPQHFHTQIFPLRLRREDKWEANSIAQLWGNVRVSGSIHRDVGGVTVTEVLFPIWGIKLEFSEGISPKDRGDILFRSIHRNLRYRSQLGLTYNVYLLSESPRTVTVLIREPKYERVFELDEILLVLEQIAGHRAASAIASSSNRMWRWAWLECIGGLPARDNSFQDVEAFGWTFWSRIWKKISLREQLRPIVLEQVCAALLEEDKLT